MQAQFQKCVCDLSLKQGLWNLIVYDNFILVGNPKQYNRKFAYGITIMLNQQCNLIDFSALYDVKSKITIILQNIYVDLSLILKCKLFWLNLINCSVDINYFAEKIVAFGFNCEQLEISNFKQPLLRLPNANELKIKQAEINIKEPNDSIKQLTLVKVKLIRFSILSFKNLQSIDLSSIQKHHTDFNTKQKIISYLQFQKKNKGTVKQLKRRAKNHRNGVEKQKIFLDKLKTYLQNNLFNMVQVSFALSQE
ncbi:Hypothetical_protein [Hexamita inflata]|uniref:Hypothetical_protein n=1 Tax=Hexamita inflata TaxID=28002 RepID=A0AA86P6S9_9EUKA|nr:Hypothetical protein HINF_LOCUS19421 [Hexamita inflata]